MTDKIASHVYDELPYPSLSFHRTYPDHLATLATLLGMRPPPVERCRVLELGCASGGNLIPMAYGLPKSNFVGLDLSARQIAEGQAIAHTLRLKNIVLKHLNILDVDADFGQFDYIIAHGVYSWTSQEVQEKIMEICQQHLAPNGVAYISYNTYPGWHMLDAIRNMVLYHTRQVHKPRARALRARKFIEFLARSIPDKYSPYASFLSAYLSFVQTSLSRLGDEVFLHDELGEINQPVYFYQFIERAARRGLQYLAEANVQTMLATNLSTEVAETLKQKAVDIVELQQYLDFLHNRTFRQTLLCHQDIQLRHEFIPERLKNLYLASSARPETSVPNVQANSIEKFRTTDGVVFATDHPITKAAMVYLTEIWPRTVSFNTLLTTAQNILAEAHTQEAISTTAANNIQVLMSNLLSAYKRSKNLVELHVFVPSIVLESTERPIASSVARLQAQNGTVVTNMRHERFDLTGTDHYHLLPYLDGTRDRAALLQLVGELTAEGIIKLQQGDVLDRKLDSILLQLANAALLVG